MGETEEFIVSLRIALDRARASLASTLAKEKQLNSQVKLQQTRYRKAKTTLQGIRLLQDKRVLAIHDRTKLDRFNAWADFSDGHEVDEGDFASTGSMDHRSGRDARDNGLPGWSRDIVRLHNEQQTTMRQIERAEYHLAIVQHLRERTRNELELQNARV